MFDLDGKLAVVTGSSRGIGRAIALTLGRQGAIIVGTATTQEGADRITDLLRSEGVRGCGKVLNVDSNESCESLLKGVVDEFGDVRILVNNAGITRDSLLMRMKPEQWDEVINTNLGSIYRMSKAVLRGMTKARWGRIVNIGSVVGSMGNPGQCNYAAAKAGMEGFGRALAAEAGVRGITVNTVAPGFIETDMTDVLPEEQKESLRSRIPAGRLGSPNEIAAVVAFLVSDAASYVTGETIHVNGGMYM